MKTAFFYLLLGFGQLFGQDMKVFGKSNEESYAGKIVRIEIGENSLTNGQSFKFWERILERASDEEAKGIIFDLDTPGGIETTNVIRSNQSLAERNLSSAWEWHKILHIKRKERKHLVHNLGRVVRKHAKGIANLIF